MTAKIRTSHLTQYTVLAHAISAFIYQPAITEVQRCQRAHNSSDDVNENVSV